MPFQPARPGLAKVVDNFLQYVKGFPDVGFGRCIGMEITDGARVLFERADADLTKPHKKEDTDYEKGPDPWEVAVINDVVVYRRDPVPFRL